MKPLISSFFVTLLVSILWAPIAFAGGWGSNQTYTSFDGKTYNMRAYNGKHVALLIQEQHLNSTGWLEITESYGAGPWPGFKEEYLEFLVGKLDEGYEFYKELYGYEPAENPQAPNNLLRIAFVPNHGAGQGLIGMKGIEVGPYYLEASIYAAKEKKIQQTIYWHEFGRNFGIGYGDVGVKYVLVDTLRMPTFMGWEYGTSYRQFAIDQVYLLGRYFLTDTKAVVDGYLTPPYNKPFVPSELRSQSIGYYNGGDVRPGMAYQFWLENGFEAYKKLVKSPPSYADQTPYGFVVGMAKWMSENNPHGLDYSYWLKDDTWNIRNSILNISEKVVLSQTAGKVGDILLLGRGDDYVQITTQGQFRIDAGDGYDVVKLPFSRLEIIHDQQTRWKRVITTKNSKIVLDFVEQVEFSDGEIVKVKNLENTMFPWLKEIKSGTFKIGKKKQPAIRLSFTEPLATEFPNDWHWYFDEKSMRPWYLELQTKSGEYIDSYTDSSPNTVLKGANLFLLLPQDYNKRGSNTLKLLICGYCFEALDKDANRLSTELRSQGYNIPLEYEFDVRTTK